MSVAWTDDYEILQNNMMANLSKDLDRLNYKPILHSLQREILEKPYIADLFKTRKFI